MPGDASSSPSADSSRTVEERASASGEALVVISALLKGAAGETVAIHLSDGSSFLLHAEAWARDAVHAGETMAPERLAALRTESEILFARARALALLARAPQTRRMLGQKLRARGFSEDAVRAAIARMAELGYLDDKAFAEAWVRSRMAVRKDGWTALYRGLLGKGVARAIAEEVVDAACPDEVELDRARALAAEGASTAAVIRRLATRGFRSRTIGRLLKERGPRAGRAPEEGEE